MPNTPAGFPYPDPTAPANGAYADMRALALAINSGVLVLSGGNYVLDTAAQRGPGVQCNLPGLPAPLTGLAVTNMPAGGNPRRRFQTMTRPAGGGLQVQAFNITEPFEGNYPPSPDNVPAIPISVIGWSALSLLQVPPTDGLYRDVAPYLETMARGVDRLGLTGRAWFAKVTPSSSGEFSLAMPGFQVTAAALHLCNTSQGGFPSVFNITSGLGTSNLACEAFTSATGMTDPSYPGPLTYPLEVTALTVGYPLDANGQRVRPRRRR